MFVGGHTQQTAARSLLQPESHPQWADYPALIRGQETVTYGQLWQRVADARDLIDTGTPRLIQVPMSTDTDSVVAYLATLESQSVALVTNEDDIHNTGILERYQPNAVWRRGLLTESDAPEHLLHPELAVLLSTSGSTGSAKLVRLSHRNIVANADAIAASLSLTSADRGITGLPLHYCYGLSVVTSHLRAGASIVISDSSVIDDAFWDDVRDHEVTDLAVVPLMAQLIAARGGIPDGLPKLRLITQAGGKLEPHEVTQWDRDCRRAGRDFCVMYGQTEATARIAVMPPKELRHNPDAVGRPIAHSTVHLEPVDDVPGIPPYAGELVFSGPGVMLGYAEHPDDLALGRMIDQLHTGDLATIDASGLVRIVGRRAEFCKIAGLRIDIPRLQSTLAESGVPAIVTGDDTSLTVAIDASRCAGKLPDVTAVRSQVAEAASLDLALVQAALLDELPTLSNGKVDRNECRRLVQAVNDSAVGSTPVTRRWWQPNRRDPGAALTRILGKDDIDTSTSFVANGGNSLNHAAAAVVLARGYGALPRDWHHRPLAEFLNTSNRRSWFLDLETSVVLRVIAVITIASNHTGATTLIGGAHALLALAGYNSARFALSNNTSSTRSRAAARTMALVAIPTAFVALSGALVTGTYKWSNVVFLQWALGPHTSGHHKVFWFIETYLFAFAIAAGVFAIPRVAKWYQSKPWTTAMALTLIAIIPKTWAVLAGLPRTEYLPWVAAWLFTLGIAIAHARTWWQKLVSLVVLGVGMYQFFEPTYYRPDRYLYVIAAIVALTLIANVRIPRPLAVPAHHLASASLFIYILQFDLFNVMDRLGLGADPWVRCIGAVLLATAIWLIFDQIVTVVSRRLHSRRNTRATSAPTP
ncbi:MAG: hypothetical protein CSA84_05840 [Actinomycetales bacterium]|nr:MAG: hypothetical protein CSA84_05840 [Actinomycetales bacterium]